MLSPAFFEGFLFMAIGYVLFRYEMQINLRKEETRRWWLPLFCRDKNGRHPLHGAFATTNILMASTFAGTVTHFIVAGRTRVSWDTEVGFSWPRTVAGLVLSLAWQSVLEYYWHRLMHLRPVYTRMHKYHHFYKSPEPFDDLMIHPLEAFGYYLQLYSPPFLFVVPVSSFLLYMVVCGVCGVLDHSGVALSMPGLYDTADHDRHHSRFEVNYAFPFPFMDVLHGTYEGNFLGKRYAASPRRLR
ncbi:unnamed protein product [Pylaiella littoralis]